MSKESLYQEVIRWTWSTTNLPWFHHSLRVSVSQKHWCAFARVFIRPIRQFWQLIKHAISRIIFQISSNWCCRFPLTPFHEISVSCFGNYIDETERMPQFLIPVANLTVTEGQDAKFTCAINNLDPYLVIEYMNFIETYFCIAFWYQINNYHFFFRLRWDG